MERDFGDLLPLFVAEARTRLERLAALASKVEADRSAAAEARRELHTLKGAARMLGVPPLAELAHQAESVLQAPRAGQGDLLVRVIDSLAAQVDALERGEDCAPGDALLEALRGASSARLAAPSVASAPPTVELPKSGPQPAGTSSPASAAPVAAEIQASTPALDQLAEQAMRVRILSRGFGHFVERLLDLASLAERGTTEAEPRQILAALASQLRGAAALVEGQGRRLAIAADAQLEIVLDLQMRPLRGAFQRLARHGRELARELGRDVDVSVEGEQAQIDRRILSEIEEALLHLVRNALDHGIESPATRREAGKPARGSLLLGAEVFGSRLRIVVTDDGAGIDSRRVLEAAQAAGLVDPDAPAPNRDEALRLLFAAGLSTKGRATEISGRGIGLDAVAAAVARVGGEVALETQLGRGTTVTLTVPVSRRGALIYVVRAGQLRLALPAACVTRVEALAVGDLVEVEGRTLLRRGERLVPCLDLTRHFGARPGAQRIVVSGEAHGRSLLVALDEIEGEEEVVLRSPAAAAGLPRIADATALLASGEPVAVLSPRGLAEAAERPMEPRAAGAFAPAAASRVLLVDDSLVTREMERRLLDDAGFLVITAGGADEALAHLAREDFDCLVTDVEMPGLDGYELTRQVRQMPRLSGLPVLLVSTLDRAEDRLRGLQAGADAYLTKQGLDADEFARIVRRLVAR